MKCLLDGFIDNVKEIPDKTAVVLGKQSQKITYDSVAKYAYNIALNLQEKGVKPGDTVAVSLERGLELIASVIGILWTGAVYVPVNLHQPIERRKDIYSQANIRYCITSAKGGAAEIEQCKNIIVEDAIRELKAYDLESVYEADVNDSAYIIFTSGSTGTPKGVEISHGGAMNTICDVLKRFNITKDDCAIAVSAIDFDLSVFDVFGMLNVGGSLVLLDESNKKEPKDWIEFIKKYNVTVWNSVPALFEMLLYSLKEKDSIDNLKVVLLSGDWVKKNIYEQIKKHCRNAKMIALGGATEASIWSNYFEVNEVKEEWNAIPYGYPLTNQCYRIVKDGKDTEKNQVGELWIGGLGLAKGYVGNKELTDKAFVMDKGQRWYRTGDVGYYDEANIIIFAGRLDQQVKVNGYRIELGEVESKVTCIEGIDTCVALANKENNGNSLVAAVELSNGNSNIETEIKVQKSDLGVNADSNENYEKPIFKLLNSLINGEQKINPSQIPESLKGTYELWKKYLDRKEKNDIQEKDLQKSNDNKQEADETWNSFFEGKEKLYKKIMENEELPQVLLEDEVLAPANLFINSSEGKTIQEKIKHKITEYIKDNNTKEILTIAFMYGRQGNLYSQIIEDLQEFKDRIKIVYFESSEGLLSDAKELYKNINLEIDYKKIQYPCANISLSGSIDLLVALNGLHTFTDIDRGLLFIKNLLRRNGSILAVENTKLTAMGIVTAAVLENGFIEYDEERRNNGSPMLKVEKWCEKLSNAGFIKITGDEYTDCDYFIFQAVRNNEGWITENQIKEYCQQNLLEYMIPKQLVYTVQWPLTANGKVDRKALAGWFAKSDDMVGTSPKTEVQIKVAEIWKKLLGLPKVYLEQSFFEIGGDSLLVSRMLAEIRECYGVSLGMMSVFENPTLEHIAETIDENINDVVFEEGEL